MPEAWTLLEQLPCQGDLLLEVRMNEIDVNVVDC